jgi:adenosylcobyric acid synthase
MALMVAGTSSWAGKSVLATALCAAFARRGLIVAPFKAQNMSNNARVVAGGEIGAAQYFQALAANVEPQVLHNPVLLKPEAETRSQVVVLGQVDRELTDMSWRERSPYLWEVVRDSYDRLAAEAELVVIEGAGSPAEINLADVDLANLRIGRHSGAPMLLVCDIDRGGAFAHLYGTWALLGAADRARLSGFVLNRFRGDPALLTPGPALLEDMTGVPTVGVVPMVDHGLPDEDGAAEQLPGAIGRRVRIVRGPAASNLDELWPLREACDCRWASAPGHLGDAELVVLPGSKLPAADLAWMAATRMDAAVRRAHSAGVPILAICGGSQALGEVIEDPHRVEHGGTVRGLGLLPVRTILRPEKTVRRSALTFVHDLSGPFGALAGMRVEGYEIRYGQTAPTAPLQAAAEEGPGFVAGNVLAVFHHGLCEDPRIVKALVGRAPGRTIAQVLDGLAELAEAHLDLDALGAIALGRRAA